MARAGHDPVIAIGFALAGEVERVAALFPSVRFTIIDAVVERPNVQSIVFKEHEGAYLVGMLAALASTGAVATSRARAAARSMLGLSIIASSTAQRSQLAQPGALA
jgi:basic membrane lipoprotein Med (substrate-binding protein (PBP1-ABC) superfamily)